MRVLCCLDGTNLDQLREAVHKLLRADESNVIGLLYVIDSGPRKDMERKREALFRPLHGPVEREVRIREAETLAAQDILQEGSRAFPAAEILQRTGRPEHEIIDTVLSWQADVVVLCPRSSEHGGPTIGPRSIGHVARFVIDHAGCPVLVVRYTNERPPQPPSQSLPRP
jgi:nucleotide-binding universal stress UspA family protein